MELQICQLLFWPSAATLLIVSVLSSAEVKANTLELEPNDTKQTSTVLQSGVILTGSLSSSSDKDYFAIPVESGSSFTISLAKTTPDSDKIEYHVEDSLTNVLLGGELDNLESDSRQIGLNSSGCFYVVISGDSQFSTNTSTDLYELTVVFDADETLSDCGGGSSNTDPSAGTVGDCDPRYVKQIGGAFNVLPFGVSDERDSENINCALREASNRAVNLVTLAQGEYFLTSAISVAGFTGVFRGVSRANTIIRIDGLRDAPITFLGGSVSLERMQLIANNIGGYSEAIVTFTSPDSNCDRRTIFPSVDRLTIDGGALSWDGPFHAFAVKARRDCALRELPILGTFKLNRTEIQGNLDGVLLSLAGGAQVDINYNEFRLTESRICTVFEGASVSGTLLGNECYGESLIHARDGLSSVGANSFVVKNNVSSGGIFVSDYAPSSLFVSDNMISSGTFSAVHVSTGDTATLIENELSSTDLFSSCISADRATIIASGNTCSTGAKYDMELRETSGSTVNQPQWLIDFRGNESLILDETGFR